MPPSESAPRIALRMLREDDSAFLRSVYASTRVPELASMGWSAVELDAFVAMQFDAQSRDYARNYDSSRFHVITFDGADCGRLYVERRADELRVIDIALLDQFRGLGIATALFIRLFEEADAAGLAVRIHVEHRNRAQQLYQRLGFSFRGEPGVIYRLMERLPHAQRAEQAA